MEPVRTCVGCRVRAPRSTLLRIVVDSSSLVIDVKACLPGRGAWVHDRADCLAHALRRRAFVRTLRISTTVDVHMIEKRLNGYGNKVNGSK